MSEKATGKRVAAIYPILNLTISQGCECNRKGPFQHFDRACRSVVQIAPGLICRILFTVVYDESRIPRRRRDEIELWELHVRGDVDPVAGRPLVQEVVRRVADWNKNVTHIWSIFIIKGEQWSPFFAVLTFQWNGEGNFAEKSFLCVSRLTAPNVEGTSLFIHRKIGQIHVAAGPDGQSEKKKKKGENKINNGFRKTHKMQQNTEMQNSRNKIRPSEKGKNRGHILAKKKRYHIQRKGLHCWPFSDLYSVEISPWIISGDNYVKWRRTVINCASVCLICVLNLRVWASDLILYVFSTCLRIKKTHVAFSSFCCQDLYLAFESLPFFFFLEPQLEKKEETKAGLGDTK